MTGEPSEAAVDGPKHGDDAGEGMRYVLCKVGFGGHYKDWLLVPHVDGQYVTAAKLSPFTIGILHHRLAAALVAPETGGSAAPAPVAGDAARRARKLLCDVCFPLGGVGADLMLDIDMPQMGVVSTEDALTAIRAALAQYRASQAGAAGGVLAEIERELQRAVAKFPTWPTDPLHASGVVMEQSGELAKAVLQAVYEPHKSTQADVRAEAIQTAAMAIRFVQSLDAEAYSWTPGKQHSQVAAPSPAAEREVR